MIGIKSFGAYVPYFRLNRAEFARAWRTASMGGEKAVANWDEDSLTMATGVGLSCLMEGPANVGGVFFATTTPPYGEKSTSSILESILDLKGEILTMDATDSPRSATSASLFAMNGVKKLGNGKGVAASLEFRNPGRDYTYKDERFLPFIFQLMFFVWWNENDASAGQGDPFPFTINCSLSGMNEDFMFEIMGMFGAIASG
jgi:hypothetical protein